MKFFRFFALLICLLAFVSIAQATQITVQSTTISGWQNTNTAPQLRIYLNKTIVTNDLRQVQFGSPQSGGFYQVVTCSVASNVLTIPSFTINSTLDNVTDQTAKYSAYFYTSSGAQIQVYNGFSSFSVPAAPTTTTWSDILVFNSTGVPYRPSDTFTKPQILALVANAGNSTAAYLLKTPDATLANAFALSTLADGLLKHSGGTPARAVPGTDYQTPLALGNLTGTNITVTGGTGAVIGSGVALSLPSTAVTPGSYTNTNLTVDAQGRITAASNGSAGVGTVTSVAMTVPAFLSVSGSPITSNGTLAVSLSGTALPIANGGTGSTSQNFVDLTNTQSVAGVKTFSSLFKLQQATINDAGWANTGATALLTQGADSTSGSPNSSGNPSLVYQTWRSGGTVGVGVPGYLYGMYRSISGGDATIGDTYNSIFLTRISGTASGLAAGNYFQTGLKAHIVVSPASIAGGANILAFNHMMAERTVANVGPCALQSEAVNNAPTDADNDGSTIDRTIGLNVAGGGIHHNSLGIQWEAGRPQSFAIGMFPKRNSIHRYVMDFTAAQYDVQGLVTTNGTTTISATAYTITTTTGNGVSPIVVTTSAAHAVYNAMPIVIASVGGNTAANGTWYAKTTGYTSTTFALYSDLSLSTPVTGNGAYTSGGTATAGTNFIKELLAGDQVSTDGVTWYEIASTPGSNTSATLTASFSGSSTGNTLTKIVQPMRLLRPSYIVATDTSSTFKLIGLDANNHVRVDASGTGIYAGTTPVQITNAAGNVLVASLSAGINLAASGGGGVTGTLPIGNGGTGQTTKAAAFDALSPMSAAGDLIYGGTSGTGTRLAAGSSTVVLHSGTTPSWSAVSLTADVSGTLPVGNGGTGQTTYTDGQLLIGNTSGNTLTKATLTGTSNQVVVTNGNGSITLSLPQSIATGSTPQFARLGLGTAAGANAAITATSYVDFGTNTIGAPSDTLTTGYRLVLYNGGSGSYYGWGIESGYSWLLSGGGGGFKFYTNSSSSPIPAMVITAAGITSHYNPAAAVASATTLTITGNIMHVSGTTTITSVSGTGITAGTTITLIFDGALTFTDGSNLKLNGNFVTTADDTITLTYDGSNWYEVARSVN